MCVFVTGSVATAVFDSGAVLVGASGGVYALIAAHLPSVFLVSIATTHRRLSSFGALAQVPPSLPLFPVSSFSPYFPLFHLSLFRSWGLSPKFSWEFG